MTRSAALLQDALQLSPAQRAKLADALLKSLPDAADTLTEAQKKTVLRRRAELRKNPRLGVPWEQVKARLNGGPA